MRRGGGGKGEEQHAGGGRTPEGVGGPSNGMSLHDTFEGGMCPGPLPVTMPRGRPCGSRDGRRGQKTLPKKSKNPKKFKKKNNRQQKSKKIPKNSQKSPQKFPNSSNKESKPPPKAPRGVLRCGPASRSGTPGPRGARRWPPPRPVWRAWARGIHRCASAHARPPPGGGDLMNKQTNANQR